MRFVDLFSGLGGFHVALTALGGRCEFASEVDPKLRELYTLNFGLSPNGDLRTCYTDIPAHEVLCAGFPCQPFSKAGEQKGLECPAQGDLFEYVERILDKVRPPFLILENVPNITRHNNGKTWLIIKSKLEHLGYSVSTRELSPHNFGIPQKRPRAFIVGSTAGLDHFKWPQFQDCGPDLKLLLDSTSPETKFLPDKLQRALELWQDFLNLIPPDEPISAFPIWAMEFGADYPILDENPADLDPIRLEEFRGVFGIPLKAVEPSERKSYLPRYVQTKGHRLPAWLQSYILSNRAFYSKHKPVLRHWLQRVKTMPASYAKLEWTWKEGPRQIWDALIQFRPSGIRVKNPELAPSLVALNASQIPVVAWERRYLSFRECAKLQGLDDLHLVGSRALLAKALGNAVNARVVKLIVQNLVIPTQASSVTRTSKKLPAQLEPRLLEKNLV